MAPVLTLLVWSRVLAVAVLVFLLTASGTTSAHPASEQVVWPSDLDRPYRERVEHIESLLGIEVDYWYSRSDKGLGNWVTSFSDERPTTFESRYAKEKGSLDITILRGDHTVAWVSAPATQVAAAGSNTTAVICVDGVCREESRPARLTTQVAVRDLPIGISFGHHNHVMIEAPPGTFDHYGTGREAIEAFATDLGIPVERLDWENARYEDRPQDHGVWWALPEVGRVACECVIVRLSDGLPFGAGSIQVVMDSDRIVQFSSNPWLLEGLGPKVSRIKAEAIAREFSAERGYDHWIPKQPTASNDTAVQSDHFVYAVFLPDAGLAWRFQAHAQGPTKSASMEVFVDAMTGGIEHEAVYPTSEGGYSADPSAPSFLMVAGVVLLALLLMRRW